MRQGLKRSHRTCHTEVRGDLPAVSVEWGEESPSGKLKRRFDIGREWKEGEGGSIEWKQLSCVFM